MGNHLLINGNKMHIELRPGGAETILFLHHSSGAAGVWKNQWSNPLLRQYTLIRMDLPGHGRSARSNAPEKAYNLQAMGKIIYSAVQQLNIDQYISVALSLSTNIIAEIAASLTNCQGYFLAGPCITAAYMTPADILQPFTYGDVLFTPSPASDNLTQYLRGLVYNQDEAVIRQLFNDFNNTDPAYRSFMGQSIAAGCWSDECLQLCQARKPIALVYGSEEKIIHTGYLKSIVLPKWQDKIHFLPNAGHLCNLDQPDLFNRLLAQFANEAFQKRP